MADSIEAVVLGNVTMDVLCYPVEHVPRHESITFKHSIVSPGGCGSNVAIGLSALGVNTALVGWIGDDVSSVLITPTWDRVGLNYSYVRRDTQLQTGISIGLIDKKHQPRFIHTSGANQLLTAQDLKIAEFAKMGTRAVHVAGYFVLPGLMDDGLMKPLKEARARGIMTSLDVVSSPNMDNPEKLWEGSLKILGDMARIYGKVKPVPENRIKYQNYIANGKIKVIETLGHAPHHQSYLFDRYLFVGEAGGFHISLPKSFYMRPATPPIFEYEISNSSIQKLLSENH